MQKSARKSIRVVIGALTHKKPDWDWCQPIRELHFQKTGLQKTSERIFHFSLEHSLALRNRRRHTHSAELLKSLGHSMTLH